MKLDDLKAGFDALAQKVFENKKIIVGAAALLVIIWKGKSVVRKAHLRSLIRIRLEERKIFMIDLRQRLNGVSIETRERRKAILGLKFEQLRDELQNGTVSAKEALEAYQWKALEANDRTNSVCLFFPQALEWAEHLDHTYKSNAEKPALFGIPISIKENIYVEGYDSTRGYAQSLFDPETKHSTVVEALRRHGAVPFVHTNIPQGLFWFGCSNPVYGTTKNPHNPKRTSGGSSGGEAALLAAGGSILGIGGDIGGSIRIPAHFCGVVGLKSTRARLSQYGSTGSVPGRQMIWASIGPMATEVNGVVAVMRLLTSDEQTLELDPYWNPLPWRDEIYKGEGGKKLKIGYYVFDGFMEAAPACQRAVEEARKILTKNGHTLVPYDPPNTPELARLFIGAAMMDGADYLYRLAATDIIDPFYAPFVRLYAIPGFVRRLLGYILRPFRPIAATLLFAAPRSTSELRSIYEEAEKARYVYAQSWKSENLDAVICPAFACVALPHDGSSKVPPAASYTTVFNLLDFVAGVVPVTKVTREDELAIKNGKYQAKNVFTKRIAKLCGEGTVGLPVGVQCVTMPFQEERCLRLMKEIEEGRKY